MKKANRANTQNQPSIALHTPVEQRPAEVQRQSTTSTTAKFIHVLNSAGQDEEAFLKKLVDEWAEPDSITTVQEATFDVASSHFGLDILHMQDIDNWQQYADYLSTVFEITHLDRTSRVSSAIATMLHLRRSGLLNTLRDLLAVLEEEFREEEADIQIAREALKANAARLGPEIRAAIKEHPELIDNAAQ